PGFPAPVRSLPRSVGRGSQACHHRVRGAPDLPPFLPAGGRSGLKERAGVLRVQRPPRTRPAARGAEHRGTPAGGPTRSARRVELILFFPFAATTARPTPIIPQEAR